MAKTSTNRGAKEYLKFIGPGTIITVLGFIIAFQFVAPAPPRHITIATGAPDGAYYKFGNAYSVILKKNGITLEAIRTAGSAENLQLLRAGDGGVDVAFLQGGMQLSDRSEDIVSLGSLYYEPLWIFQDDRSEVNYLSNLKGKRVAVGLEGSGTKVLAMQLLTLNGVSSQNTFSNELYHLRLHIEMLREKLIKTGRRSHQDTSSA